MSGNPTPPEKVSDEQIAAYIDGSLEAADAAVVAAAIENDPAIRAYAEELREANRLLREAFDGPMTKPVSAELRNTIMGAEETQTGAKVVDFARAREARRPWAGMALAASIALVIGITSTTVFFDAGRNNAEPLVALGPTATESPLHAALETLPSGRVSEEGLQLMLSFRDGAGRICREFELAGKTPAQMDFGIACRSDAGQWQVEIVVTGPTSAPNSDGIVPASGPAEDALNAMLDSLGAEPALSPAEEAKLLQDAWR